MNDKMILDVTCGDRTIWFQKNEPHTLYCDIRREEWEGDFGKTLRADGKKKHRHLVINPDIQCSFTDLPFEDNTFSLIVFDPPHIENLSENAWMRKSYGSLDGDWKPMIRKGFEECMRVLRVGGVLIFKWSDISVSTRNIINVIGQEPLFGHRSGKKMNTHWMTYMKFDTDADHKTEPTISKMEQVEDKPQTEECPFDDAIPCEWVCTEYGNCKYKQKTEPQTCSFSDCDNFKNPDYERCIECKRKQIKQKTDPQTEREGE